MSDTWTRKDRQKAQGLLARRSRVSAISVKTLARSKNDIVRLEALGVGGARSDVQAGPGQVLVCETLSADGSRRTIRLKLTRGPLSPRIKRYLLLAIEGVAEAEGNRPRLGTHSGPERLAHHPPNEPGGVVSSTAYDASGGVTEQDAPRAVDAIGGITDMARQTFGDARKGWEWLNRPTSALGNVTPVSLLSSSVGRERVAALLGRIAHGILPPAVS